MSCGVGHRRGSDSVAWAGSCSSDSAPSLGTSKRYGAALKGRRKKKKYCTSSVLNFQLLCILANTCQF